MPDEQSQILVALLARHDKHRRTRRPPAWHHLESHEHDEETAYGPRYSPTWFGDLTDTDRRRFHRALVKLEAAGLVVLDRPWGQRFSRVKLSSAGIAAAKKLEGK